MRMLMSMLIYAWWLAVCVKGVLAAEAPQTLDVWPAKPPGPALQASEQWQGKRVTNVTHPNLEVFRPESDKDTGVAVIVCPGGGYRVLMMSYEGEDVARWLNSIGVTAVVLKYRVPAPSDVPRYLPALQDAQRTLSLVRSKAAEWKIKPDHIGIMGFSAGGHLTAAACTNFDKRAYEPVDSVDQTSCRPDFGVSIYPGGVVPRDQSALSPEIRVTHETPPMFIVQANDDRTVSSDNSAYLYLALKQAGVPAELHIFASGGHGFGLGKAGTPASNWPRLCELWMRARGIIPAAGDASAK